MNYNTLHKSHQRLDLTVTFVLLGAALLTMLMMFIHPSVAIFMFWLGMLIAGGAMLIGLYLRRRERIAVRNAAAAHQCPNCGYDVGRGPGQSPLWHCDQCGTEFSTDGEVLANAND